MRRRVGFAIIGATGLAAGCAYDPTLLDATDTVLYEIPAVRVMEPQGPEFNQGLREGYLDLGQTMGSDFPDKLHFEFKAVDSAKGNLVLPDTVESRWLAADRAEELAAARARLLAALDQSGRDKAPEPAAEAQVAFDCWLEQAVWSAEANLTCKERFETAIAEVERALTTEGNVYLVFFAWDQADLTPVTMAVLDQVAADYASGRPTRVTLSGHADRSGTEAYNDALSEQRAQNVARALAARGVPERALDVQWFGERQPRIPSEDGVREPQNRRVEIVFGEPGPSA
jgi:OmpA-OmpF porin, OOP family